MDRTEQILRAKYAPHTLNAEAANAASVVSDVQKSAIPPIGNYENLQDWLRDAVAVTLNWPSNLRKAVLAQMMEAHNAS